MTRFNHEKTRLRTGLWILLVWVVTSGLGLPHAWAQVRDDLDEPEPQVQPNQMFMIDESNFDMWVFGGARNAAGGRARLETLYRLRLSELDRTCHLTDPQKKKLELAARGDIKRFFDKVEAKRRDFQLVRNDQQKFGQFYQQIQPLQQMFNAGLFGVNSLYGKMSKSTLESGQLADANTLNRQRLMLQQQLCLGRIFMVLDQNLGLLASQRKKLTKLILEETKPPRKSGNYDLYVVLHQLAQLPEERLKPIFIEIQWIEMSQLLRRSKGYQQMLVSQGVLPDQSDEGWSIGAESQPAPPAPPSH